VRRRLRRTVPRMRAGSMRERLSSIDWSAILTGTSPGTRPANWEGGSGPDSKLGEGREDGGMGAGAEASPLLAVLSTLPLAVCAFESMKNMPHSALSVCCIKSLISLTPRAAPSHVRSHA
jgi:hypothetical protein